MVSGSTKGKYSALLKAGKHDVLSGVSAMLGGDDEGPNPHELLEGALVACTIITCQMYAERHQWPLESTAVHVRIVSETKFKTVIQREVQFKGNLSDEQRKRLLEIANKCPIHQVLLGPFDIETQLLPIETSV